MSTTPVSKTGKDLEIVVRRAGEADRNAVWTIMEPVIRAGETYALPREMERDAALDFWFAQGHEVFVAEHAGSVAGTYFLRPNQKGGGSHVANCGYMTAAAARGRGVASAMCTHSLAYAKEQGFRSMQFNFVVSTNVGAVRLWEKLGFEIAGRLRGAFLHPSAGYVDAYVMYRML